MTPPAGLGLLDAQSAPRFNAPVLSNGYAWWRVDARSDDGRHGIAVIAFVGSVLSPYYAWARRGGRAAEPTEHCALNIALYGRPGGWAMTERSAKALLRDARSLSIGPSLLHWDGGALIIAVNETAAPVPRPIRGTIRVTPAALTGARFPLDAAGRHRWSPIAPISRIDVRLERPALRWSGSGHLDANDGDRPLEADFRHWGWCRAPTRSGAAILYNAECIDGGKQSLALRVAPSGAVSRFAAPPRANLGPTLWRISRHAGADLGASPRVRQTLADAPFYARSVIETTLDGEALTAVHESFDMRRFTAPWVQAMLPFRVPRWDWRQSVGRV